MSLIQSTSVKLSGVNSTAAHPSLTGVTAGNTLVFVTNTFNTLDKLPTDSAGQTWSKAKFYNPVAPHECDIGVYYLLNANAGTHTLSWLVGDGPNGGFLFGTMSEAPASSGLDVAGSGTVNSGGNPTSISASVTTSAASTFTFGSMCIGSNSGNTNCNISNPPSGWTAVGVSQNSSSDQAAEVCYKEQTSAGAQTANWTFTADPTSADVSALAVSFVNTSGGGGVTVGLTGLSGTASIGTPAPSISKSLGGFNATGSLGTLATITTLPVAGLSSTSTIGTPSPNVSVGLTGVTATSLIGVVTPTSPGGANVTGVLTTSSINPPGVNISVGLTGVSASGSTGNIGPAISLGLAGLSATGAIGSPGVSITKLLAGVTGTGSVGTVTPSGGGSITLPLNGFSASGSIGTPGVGVTVGLTGVSAIGSVGSVIPSGGTPVTPAGTAVAAWPSISGYASVAQQYISNVPF